MLSKLLFTLFFLLGSAFADQIAGVPPASAPHLVESPVPFSEQAISSKSNEPSYEHAFLKMILTLGGLLLLVFFTLWAIRKLSHGRIGNFGSAKKIKILEKRPLSPKTAIYHLELDGRRVFITESQLEVKTLLEPHEMDAD